MPQTRHIEKHFTAGDVVRDIVIGMSDGLTVPFALAAGLSSTVTATGVIVAAGIAEIVAGSISMGLGGYLAAKGDEEHYAAERAREEREVIEMPGEELREVADIFKTYGLTGAEVRPLLQVMRDRPQAWVDFMMRFELGLEEPDPKRAKTSAATIAAAYAVGGLVPLLPYILVHQVRPAFELSVVFTLVALVIFGYLKARFIGQRPWRGAGQTVLVGGLAAFAAYFLARLFSSL